MLYKLIFKSSKIASSILSQSFKFTENLFAFLLLFAICCKVSEIIFPEVSVHYLLPNLAKFIENVFNFSLFNAIYYNPKNNSFVPPFDTFWFPKFFKFSVIFSN